MYGITLPNNGEVSFKYDPLGRRIEKKAVTEGETKTTRFVWDGNNPIHEWVENENESQNKLITWVFNDGFIPMSKITSEGNYSIVSDYLGTPVEAYDKDGNKVWAAELDIYGRIKTTEGNADFIPFRYQGQYSDSETGLYYNRFRYYDPMDGQYITQDPIGLAGSNPTLYGYVHNPLAWIDPFGLDCEKAMKAGSPGSKTWKQAVKEIKGGKGKGINVITNSREDAICMLEETKPMLEEKETYTKEVYKDGFEFHPIELGVNDLPHIKWKNWSQGKAKGSEGHIFYPEE